MKLTSRIHAELAVALPLYTPRPSRPANAATMSCHHYNTIQPRFKMPPKLVLNPRYFEKNPDTDQYKIRHPISVVFSFLIQIMLPPRTIAPICLYSCVILERNPHQEYSYIHMNSGIETSLSPVQPQVRTSANSTHASHES